MNYLAHFQLSKNNTDLIIGNYIADDVKGKAYLEYSTDIQRGIMLHRKIDSFTDTHPIVEQSKKRIRKDQGKFTPVVMDVFYDYFLAKNWTSYSNVALLEFTTAIYQTLTNNLSKLPPRSRERLPYMKKNNWLYNYQKIAGINKALSGMARRTKYANNMNQAHIILKKEEDKLQDDFNQFYPELINFVNQEIANKTIGT